MAFWTLAGWGLLALFKAPFNRLQKALLSPAIGIVATLLPLFVINRWGVPINRFAVPLCIAMVIGSVLVAWRRAAFPWRATWPFGVVLLVGLLISGRPLLIYGFDWLSYCNDDMANYCLAAERFLTEGFYDPPQRSDIEGGQDYLKIFWFMHVPSKNRAGSELLLAFVSGVTGLNPHRTFMPTILAMHLAQIAAAGGLICRNWGMRRVTLIAVAMITLSALLTFGTLYQLIAQVGGMATLIACAAVVMRPVQHLPRKAIVSLGLLAGLMVAGQLALYPEVCPFLGVAFFLYLGIGIARGQLRPWPTLTAIAIGGLFCMVLLNAFAVNMLLFLLSQTKGGFLPDDPTTTLFPFYLVPVGLANAWGLLTIAAPSTEPWTSLAILAGLVLTLASVVAAVRTALRGHPVGAFAAVMFVMSLSLFFNRSGFGLYKVAMYAQPFVIGSLVIWWVGRTRNRPVLQLAPLIAVSGLGLATLNHYVGNSYGAGSTFIEVPMASETDINREFATKLATVPAETRVISDSYNIVLTKFQAMYTRGRETYYPANSLDRLVNFPQPGGILPSGTMELTKQLIDGIRSHLHVNWLPLAPGARHTRFDRFISNSAHDLSSETAGEAVLVRTSGRLLLFNRRRNADITENFAVEPLAAVRNYLLFAESTRGRNYYLSGASRAVAMFQLERDPLFYTQRSMSGVGRHMMFHVLNPDERVRVLIDFTSSFRADGKNRLPNAAAIGDARVPFGLIGNGSARFVSPPIKPTSINGRAYVAVDFGEDGTLFPTRKVGLMQLYGRDVVNDRRRLVGFARDVSLISEQEYQKLAPVHCIASFKTGPASEGGNDLLNPDLIYSGIYEDGWCGEAAMARLTPTSSAQSTLRVAGTVPGLADPTFQTVLTVRVGDEVVATETLKPGEFDVRVPVTATGPQDVVLQFSRTQALPGGDNRPASALLTFFGFTSEPMQAAAAAAR
jgi:hypothetical protein